jgi:E3 SUMO-protein ligase PIAS1
MAPMLVKKHSVEELAERIKMRSVISKLRVITESKQILLCVCLDTLNSPATVVTKASDPDIEAMSSVMSLKDPVSYMRITLPCRSTVCSHNQCFDAASFLQLQEQAPTWTCPICQKIVAFEALAVDQ